MMNWFCLCYYYFVVVLLLKGYYFCVIKFFLMFWIKYILKEKIIGRVEELVNC